MVQKGLFQINSVVFTIAVTLFHKNCTVIGSVLVCCVLLGVTVKKSMSLNVTRNTPDLKVLSCKTINTTLKESNYILFLTPLRSRLFMFFLLAMWYFRKLFLIPVRQWNLRHHPGEMLLESISVGFCVIASWEHKSAIGNITVICCCPWRKFVSGVNDSMKRFLQVWSEL